MNYQIKSLALIGLISFIGGSLGVVNKFGLREIPPFGFVASRVIVSLVLISPWLFKTPIFISKARVKLLTFSLLATANIGLFILGINLTNVSIAAILYATVPIFTLIISYLIYGEKISPRKTTGIMLGLTGALIVGLTPILKKDQPQFGSLEGNLIIFLAVLIFSLHTALSKKAQNRFSPRAITMAFIVTATIVLTPLAIWEWSTTNWLTSLTWKSALAILYVSAIGTVIYYFLYQQTVKTSSPFITSLSMYSTTIIGIMLAVVFLGEPLTTEIIIGSALSLSGIALATSQK